MAYPMPLEMSLPNLKCKLVSGHVRIRSERLFTFRALKQEVERLEGLAHKSVAIKIFDHEEYKKVIMQVVQHIDNLTTTLQVRKLTVNPNQICLMFLGRDDNQYPEDCQSDRQ